MKKILLSITALTFGATVAFAQTEIETQEPQQEAQGQEAQSEELQVERLSNENEAGKRKIEMTELPASVQEAFQNSEFKDWEVAEIYEVGASSTEDAIIDSSTTTPEEAAEGAATPEVGTQEASYEILVISKDMKDEIEDTQETVQEEAENALEDGEAAEASTETVKVEIPAVILKYDNQGQLLEQEEQKGETENDQY